MSRNKQVGVIRADLDHEVAISKLFRALVEHHPIFIKILGLPHDWSVLLPKILRRFNASRVLRRPHWPWSLCRVDPWKRVIALLLLFLIELKLSSLAIIVLGVLQYILLQLFNLLVILVPLVHRVGGRLLL